MRVEGEAWSEGRGASLENPSLRRRPPAVEIRLGSQNRGVCVGRVPGTAGLWRPQPRTFGLGWGRGPGGLQGWDPPPNGFLRRLLAD